jgi:hypothetical protein
MIIYRYFQRHIQTLLENEDWIKKNEEEEEEEF